MEWLPIRGYEKYEINREGQVRSLIGQYKLLKPRIVSKGYHQVGLSKDGVRKHFLLHRLVAQTFLENNELPEVNHKDGNKANNKVENLEWCSRSHNMKELFRSGYIHHTTIVSDEDIVEAIRRVDSGETLRSVAKDYPIAEQSLGRRIKRRREVLNVC